MLSEPTAICRRLIGHQHYLCSRVNKKNFFNCYLNGKNQKKKEKKKELKFLLGRELPLLRKQHGNSLWTWKGKPASSCRRPQSRANHAAEEALGVCDPGNGKRAKTSLLEKSPRRPNSAVGDSGGKGPVEP